MNHKGGILLELIVVMIISMVVLAGGISGTRFFYKFQLQQAAVRVSSFFYTAQMNAYVREKEIDIICDEDSLIQIKEGVPISKLQLNFVSILSCGDIHFLPFYTARSGSVVISKGRMDRKITVNGLGKITISDVN